VDNRNPDVKVVKLADLAPDPANANKGTERGRRLIRQSLKEHGAGRSVVADRNGTLIGGNKTRDAALAEGMQEAIVVETDGTRLVVVKRTDLDLETDPKARELAYADNRASELGLNWDMDRIKADFDKGIAVGKFWNPDELRDKLAAMSAQLSQLPEPNLDFLDEPEPMGDDRALVPMGDAHDDFSNNPTGSGNEQPLEEDLNAEQLGPGMSVEVNKSGLARDEKTYHMAFDVDFDNSIVVQRAIKEWQAQTQMTPAEWLIHMAERFLNGI
jgi:hypothetical protein